jgi:hypothetical protein
MKYGYYGTYKGKEYYIKDLTKKTSRIISEDINDLNTNGFEAVDYIDAFDGEQIEGYFKEIQTSELKNIVHINYYVIYQNEKMYVLFEKDDSYCVGTNDNIIFGKFKFFKNMPLGIYKWTGLIPKEKLYEEIENINSEELK